MWCITELMYGIFQPNCHVKVYMCLYFVIQNSFIIKKKANINNFIKVTLLWCYIKVLASANCNKQCRMFLHWCKEVVKSYVHCKWTFIHVSHQSLRLILHPYFKQSTWRVSLQCGLSCDASKSQTKKKLSYKKNTWRVSLQCGISCDASIDEAD